MSRRFVISFGVLALYAVAMLALVIFMSLTETGAKIVTKPCITFACIEHAQLSSKIDGAFEANADTKDGKRPVSCASRAWKEGPVIVCRWKD